MNALRDTVSFIFVGIFILSCRTNSHPHTQEINLPKKSFESTSFTLDKKLDEISGLQIDGDEFYGFNDSGGKAELYKINKKGAITQTIHLEGAQNIDWESMAMNDSLIFLADVGNNRGNRKDLCIYYIHKAEIDVNRAVQKVNAKKITFYYPEQTHFEIQTHAHDFDCEAICWFNHQLHLFTKEWKSKQTHHYTLELTEKRQAAQLIDSFNTKFLVTEADIFKINEQTSLLALIGYTKLRTVHLILSEIPNKQKNLLGFPKRTTYLGGAAKLGQVEGIALFSPKILYYSAEAYKGVPQHITRLELKD